MKSKFLEKLVERIDRLDPESLQTHFLRLASRSGLLETIFQSIQEGVVVVDQSGVLRYANKSAEEMLGFSADSAVGKPIARFLKGMDWERILDLDTMEWSKLISSEIEINYPSHRYVSFYMVPLVTEEDDQEGVVMMLRDVTSDRLQEEGMLESERLNAVKLLAAGVAHEIGNPLNALTIHLQLLSRDIGKLEKSGGGKKVTINQSALGNLKDLVEIAKNEVARLDVIITQFLKAVRPTRPKMGASRIEDVLQETLSLLKSEIENRRIAVEINYKQELPSVRLDKNQMKQAFFNVIKNALQAMPNGGSLDIEAEATDGTVSIYFRDTGEGIPSGDLGRIFEPYKTTRESGSGLGLMVVQRIVQDHGGRIEIESKPGKGTSFGIILPRAKRRLRLLPRSEESVKLRPTPEKDSTP